MNLLVWLRHLFIPHQSNNHKARILHPASLSAIVAIFLIGQFVLNIFTLFSPTILGYASNVTPERVADLTNQKRAERGLPPLAINSKLNEVAQRKAGDMFAFNYWAHTSPSGRDPWSFFKEAGYRYVYAGENLARDFMNSESVVEAWMNSPSHRDNIINSSYKEIGLAVVNGTLNGVETTWVIQVFGTPTPAQVAQVAQVRKETPIPTVPSGRLGEASLTEEKSLFPPSFNSVALAQGSEEVTAPLLFSPFLITKTLVVFLLGIIFGALLVDAILVYRKRIVRLSGKNLAHLIFIGALLLAVVITHSGAIL